jgi:putative transposase
MISLCHRGCRGRERDDGAELQRGPFPLGDHSYVRSPVRAVSADESEANAAAIRSYNEDHGTAIIIRRVKHLNNIVEQDHRGVKRVRRPILGFTFFDATQYILAGIALMHMLRKGQREEGVEQGLTSARQFYALAT